MLNWEKIEIAHVKWCVITQRFFADSCSKFFMFYWTLKQWWVAYGCSVISSKDLTQSFIIRVWLEQHESKDVSPEWRGVIENVGSGERVYFISLDQLTAYVTSILEVMGARIIKP